MKVSTIISFKPFKRLLLLPTVISLLFSTSCNTIPKNEPDITKLITFSGEQLELLIQNTEKIIATGVNDSRPDRPLVVPRNLNDDGTLRLIPSRDWVSGFFPGTLWFMYQFTGQSKWKAAAEKYTAPIEREKFTTTTHDLGFILGCSFGKGYELTANPAYRDVMIQAAKTLITRFNPKVGAIRSWDHNSDKWMYPVIIDNMMNLELLFWASKETSDPVYANIAVKHAQTTLDNHFRDDFSTYHVIDYDTLTGEVLNKHTHQGLNHKSAWARGQAWGLYGYTMTYRETGMPQFLIQAERIADFYLNHPNLPKDLVPYWDFNVEPGMGEPRDVSAACITASALLELASFIPAKKDFYNEKATQMLKSLAESYLSPPGGNQGFILAHSTGHKPHNSEVDVPIIYAEYYFLEALARKNNINKSNK